MTIALRKVLKTKRNVSLSFGDSREGGGFIEIIFYISLCFYEARNKVCIY